MGTNCNLELRLFPARMADSDHPASDSGRSQSEEPMENSQQLTIFYKGRICVYDATEIQAREILHIANQETKERLKAYQLQLLPASQKPQSQPSALSMKRSLQLFLQKRKSRIQSVSPYKQ